MADLRWTKIKDCNGDAIELEYQRKNHSEGEYEDCSIHGPEEARPTFYRVLKELAPFVVMLCEFPEDYEDRITVSGVCLNYDENGIMKACILAKMALVKSKGVICLNTPWKAEKRLSDIPDVTGKGADVLPEKAKQLIAQLKAEAKKYLEGERLQAKLTLKDGKKAASGEKDDKDESDEKEKGSK